MFTTQLATAPWQLAQAAEAYDTAAVTLEGAAGQKLPFQQHLGRALGVEWESPAGRAFRTAAEALHLPGEHLGAESSAIAEQCRAVAAELRDLAELARQVQQIVHMLANPELRATFAGILAADHLDWFWHRAAGALNSAHEMAEFLKDSGGIPWVLREAAARI